VQGLTVAEPKFPGDDGTADPAVRAALAAYAAGRGSEHAALTALARSRLLVPVVAVLGEVAEDGSEKSTEMALPTLVGRDGRRAVLAFTCLDALKQWRSDARPVPVPAASAWLAGTQDDASAVLIDVAGPVTLAVDGARLAALAAGRPVPLPHQDPEVLAALQAALAREPLIVAAALTSPDQRVTATGGADPDHEDHAGQDLNGSAQEPDGTAAEDGADGSSPGADLALQVTIAPGCDPAAAGAAVRRAADALLAATGDRLRRGVEVSVAQGSRTAGSP
jgi:SseB protein N-terminal domain